MVVTSDCKNWITARRSCYFRYGTLPSAMTQKLWLTPKERRSFITTQVYAEAVSWKKLITFSKLTDGKTNLRGYYSFIEDFKRSGVSTTWSRKAYFGNCWIRKTIGEWLFVSRATFKADSNPAANIDAGSDVDRFFLATGGETKNSGSKLEELIYLKTVDIRKPPEGLPDSGS